MIESSAAGRIAAIEIAAVIERGAPRGIPGVIEQDRVVMPVKSPVMPSPSVTAEPPDSEAEPE
jgi:hypothetical protein